MASGGSASARGEFVSRLNPFTAGEEPAEERVRLAREQGPNDPRVVRIPDDKPDGVELLRAPAPSTRARQQRLSLSLVCTDALCLLGALLAAYVIRFGVGRPPKNYALFLLIGPVLWVGVFHLFALYSPHLLSAAEEFRRSVSAVFVGIVVLIVAVFSLQSVVSRAWVGLTLILALVLELFTRWAWHRYRARLRSRGRLALRTLIIGSKEQAGRVARTLRVPGHGFVPLGYVDMSGPLLAAADSVTARAERLRAAIRAQGAECLFLVSPTIGYEEFLVIAQAARQERAELRVLAHLPNVLSSRVAVQSMGGEGIALTLKPVAFTRTQAMMKRAFDVAGAGLALVMLLPLLVAIAVAIKLASRGPVLFRQERVTEGGRLFHMYKFRTMIEDADAIQRERGIDPTVPFFKMADDPRLAPMGRMLRRLSLDELPQLVNVLRGDMSLVGPRPLAADQVREKRDLLAPRHEVRAGVTGWWQINGRSDVGMEEAVRMDAFYIENWSLTLDLYILLKTVGVLLRRRGAY